MKFVFLALLFLSGQVCAKDPRIPIAIIDTGFVFTPASETWLCKERWHKDFSGSNTLIDIQGHGLNVSWLITRHISPLDHCLVIIKWFHRGEADRFLNLVAAIKYAATLPIKYVNISAGGNGTLPEEKEALAAMLKKGVRVVVAAGNNAQNLDQKCNYFPACYGFQDKNFYVIGAYEKLGTPARFSNYGTIVRDWADGVDEGTGSGVTMSGTSQACANFTGQLAKKELAR